MSDTANTGLPVYSVNGHVGRIELARPERRNALRQQDLRWLLDRFAAINANPDIRVVMLAARSSGRSRPVFCAGFDVAGFDDPDHDPRLFEMVVDALEALRPITVCALSGSVHGGATDLMLACDLRVAVRGAEFHMPAARLGLHYYPSGLRRFVSRLGPDLEKRAILGGRGLAVEELQAAGVFDALCGTDALMAAADELAHRVAQLAPRAAQDMKRSIREIAMGDFNVPRLREREALALASADFAEGRAALAQDRPARFQGR